MATTDTCCSRSTGCRSGWSTPVIRTSGSAVDCLETLEEVAMMLAEAFASRGGTLRYIPCLNDRPAHAQALAAIVREALADWTPENA